MPGRVTIPRGIAIEYGRNFGLRYDRGDMPSISLFVVRVYALRDGMAGIVLRFVGDRQQLREARDEITRLKHKCVDQCRDCPLLPGRQDPS